MSGQLHTLAAWPSVPIVRGPELVERRKIEIAFKSKFSVLGCDAVYFRAHTTYQSGIPEDCHHETCVILHRCINFRIYIFIIKISSPVWLFYSVHEHIKENKAY